MDSQDGNLKNGGEHITDQPATTMLGLELFLRDTCFLEEVC
jgi:hypothetical protein